MSLENEKYVLLTTFRRDRTPVATPVWIVPIGDGRFGFWTSSASGKAKRIAHTSRVTVQPSDVRGRVKPGSTVQAATASITTGPDYATIRAKVKAKYGVMTSVTRFLAIVGGVFKRKQIPYADVGVVITLTT